jgi:hypothetical protein
MTETPTTERKKPGRKPKGIDVNSPEFQAAVAKAAGEAVAGALGQLQGNLAGQSQGADKNLLEGLAVALAEIGSQGTGRKAVAPHILKQRSDARDRMVELILAARKGRHVPTYRLTNKVVLAERIIEPFWITSDKKTKHTEIDYYGIPNEAMVPVNDTAKAIHSAFMDSIGTVERVAPEERLGVTPNGLVVRNAAVTDTMAKRTSGEAKHVGDGHSNDEVVIHHENEPGRYKTVNVLGTVQEPARQSI